MKQAIVFGTSGLVGSFILQELLANENYNKVSIVVRKDIGIYHPKLEVIIGDYHSISSMPSVFATDEIFIALGTTLKKSPDRSAYYQIDHDYPLLAARLAKDSGAKKIFIVSAIGADPGSRFFYPRTKGELEKDIIALNFETAHIFRPSMILGKRTEKRFMENILQKTARVISPFFKGTWSKYRGMEASDIAKAIVKSSEGSTTENVKIYFWEDMSNLLMK